MADLTLDFDQVDKLADEFWEDFKTFAEPLRSRGVAWVEAGEQIRDRMDPEQFLAWCWRRRREILSAELSVFARRGRLHDQQAFQAGRATPNNKAGILALLEQKSGNRQARLRKAGERELRGCMSEHYDVPGKAHMPVGLMDASDLKAVARSLQGQAHDIMRKARFLRRLAAGLPPGVTVAGHYSEAQVESMWSTMQALAS